MRLQTYHGWPIMANYSPLEGKWFLKTRKNGHAVGAIGKAPLKECLDCFMKWLGEEPC